MRVLKTEDCFYVSGGDGDGDNGFGGTAGANDGYGSGTGTGGLGDQASTGCNLAGAVVGGAVGSKFGGTAGAIAGALATGLCEAVFGDASTGPSGYGGGDANNTSTSSPIYSYGGGGENGSN
jgi:hypothetical protein